MNRINVFSLPRSGTNLFASLMHNHPEIFSINSGGGSKPEIIFDENEIKRRCIYASGGINKDFNKIKYVLLDEMHIESYNKFSGSNICLIRNIDSIKNSILNFNKKYKYYWNPFLLRNLDVSYNNILDFAKKDNVLGIYVESIVKYPKESFQQICDFLNIEYDESMYTFKNSFKKHKCECGNDFTTTKSDLLFGSYFRKRNIRDKKQSTYFYCDKCKVISAGYGGFNPYNDLDFNRVVNENDLDKDWSLENMNKLLNNK